MGEDHTTIRSHGPSTQRVWELLVTRCMPGANVVFDGNVLRLDDSDGTSTCILSLRPLGPDTTELLLWGPPGHGLVDALVGEPGSTVFVQREVSKGIDWESHRLLRGSDVLFSCGIGPDGDREVRVGDETVFASEERYEEDQDANAINARNAAAYAEAVCSALTAIAERFGDAASVLDAFRARMEARGDERTPTWRPDGPASDTAGGERAGDSDDIPF